MRHLLHIYLVFWPRLPVNGGLFRWVQAVHSFLVLYLKQVKRLSRVNRSGIAASRSGMSMTIDRAKSKKTIRAVQRGFVQYAHVKKFMQRFRVDTIMVYKF